MVKSTLALGQNADFRAITMMGIFGAVGVALFAAIASFLSGQHPFWPAIIAASTMSGGLFVAAACCAAAAWPGKFFVAGFAPRNLINSSAKNDQFRTRVLIAVVQDRIDHNERALSRNARFVMIAIWVAGCSLLAGAAVLIALSLAENRLYGMEHPPVSVVVHAPELAKAVEAAEPGTAPAVVHRP